MIMTMMEIGYTYKLGGRLWAVSTSSVDLSGGLQCRLDGTQVTTQYLRFRMVIRKI